MKNRSKVLWLFAVAIIVLSISGLYFIHQNDNIVFAPGVLARSHFPGNFFVAGEFEYSLMSFYDLDVYQRLADYVQLQCTDTTRIVGIANIYDARRRNTALAYRNKNRDTVFSLPKDSILLLNYHWLISNHPDTLRLIFIRNFNDPKDTSIVDTSFYYAGHQYDRIFGWNFVPSFDNITERWSIETDAHFSPRQTPYQSRPFITYISIWSKERFFRILWDNSWYYDDCDSNIDVFATETREGRFAQDMIKLFCTLRGFGAFQNDDFVWLEELAGLKDSQKDRERWKARFRSKRNLESKLNQ